MSHHPFKWPRSDGDASKWPKVGRQAGEDAWHDRPGANDKKYELYEKKIGDLLASRLAIQGQGTYQLDNDRQSQLGGS